MNIGGMIGGFISGILAFYWIYILVLLVLTIIPYIITGYMIRCIGRKAKVDDGIGWMPFLPIARQLYMMKIVDRPAWHALFFNDAGVLRVVSYSLILGISSLLMMIHTGFGIVVGIILALAYTVCVLVFSFRYYWDFYQKFHCNPNMTWLEILPVLDFVPVVFKMLIAFTDAIYKEEKGVDDRGEEPINSRSASIIGISGQYQGASFNINDGYTITVGRSADKCQIVFDQGTEGISREHCRISFDAVSDCFYVTDCSTYGTFLENGMRLEKGVDKRVKRGTVIYLGNQKNGLRLE